MPPRRFLFTKAFGLAEEEPALNGARFAMLDYRHPVREWRRLREIVGMVARSESCRTGAIELCYPQTGWYAAHAAEMLAILGEIAVDLEREFGVGLPATCCYVVEPEMAEAIQGTPGAAYRDMIIVGVAERHLSELAGIGAHELAHVLAARLGSYDPPFKGEGFACYAAWRIRASRMPMGLPLHYHLAWLLSVGVKPRLEELWHRRDYTPELYDLAWSFAAYLAARYGTARYLEFYGSQRACLRDQVDETLGLPLARLDREWHDHARGGVDIDPSRISRMHRYAGCICSRAAWLRQR